MHWNKGLRDEHFQKKGNAGAPSRTTMVRGKTCGDNHMTVWGPEMARQGSRLVTNNRRENVPYKYEVGDEVCLRSKQAMLAEE